MEDSLFFQFPDIEKQTKSIKGRKYIWLNTICALKLVLKFDIIFLGQFDLNFLANFDSVVKNMYQLESNLKNLIMNFEFQLDIFSVR